MKKILLGTAVAVALLTGCSEEKKPATQATTPTAQTQTTAPTPTAPSEAKKEEAK